LWSVLFQKQLATKKNCTDNIKFPEAYEISNFLNATEDVYDLANWADIVGNNTFGRQPIKYLAVAVNSDSCYFMEEFYHLMDVKGICLYIPRKLMYLSASAVTYLTQILHRY
jgi:hypothetical protein